MKWICQIYDWDVNQVVMEQVMDDESAQLFREFCEESDIEYLCEPIMTYEKKTEAFADSFFEGESIFNS